MDEFKQSLDKKPALQMHEIENSKNKSKTNRYITIGLGILLAMVGISLIFGQVTNRFYMGFGIGFPLLIPSVLTLVLGAVLLLAYANKRSTLSLIIGGYLLYYGSINIGLIRHVCRNFLHMSNFSMFLTGFFLVPGLIFLILYYDKNKHYLLIPGNILLWIGLYLLLQNLPFLGPKNPFLIFIGLSYISAYFMGRLKSMKGLLYVGILIVVVGLLYYLQIPLLRTFLSSIRLMVSVGILIFGLVTIYYALKNSNDK